MTACKLGFGMDIGACLHGLAFGWVPDWVWALLPYWPWVVVIGGVGMAYRFAGWPGVAAFFGGVGFIAGRMSVKHVSTDEQYQHPDPKAPKPVRRKRPTIFDGLRK